MEEGSDGRNPGSKGSFHHFNSHLPTHQQGIRRRVKRRYRRNQDAINFLRRFTLAVVLVDLMLAISESTLMSTFFLYLTLSTTFDVKPENVMDTYCYYESAGNTLCENYMERLTRYPSSTPPTPTGNHYHRGGSSSGPSSTSTPAGATTERHFPTIPSRPPLTENEAYQLFLVYNQSFYDSPARFTITRKIDRQSTLSKFYSKLVYVLSGSGNGNADDDSDNEHKRPANGILSSEKLAKFVESSLAESSPSALLPSETELLKHLHHALEVVSPSAPRLGKGASRLQMRQALTLTLKPAFPNGSHFRLEEFYLKEQISSKLPGKNIPVQYADLMQVKELIRHRWKRSVIATQRPTFIQTAVAGGVKASLEEPRQMPPTTGAMLAATLRNQGTTSDERKTTPAWNLLQGMDKSSHYYPSEQQSSTYQGTKVSQRRGDSAVGSNSSDQEHDSETNNRMRSTLMNGESKEVGESPETPFIRSTKQMQRKHEQVGDHHVKLKSSGSPPLTSPNHVNSATNLKTNLDALITAAEINLNEFLSQLDEKRRGDLKGRNATPIRSGTIGPEGGAPPIKRKGKKLWKNLHDMLAKMEKSPRVLLGLMEASLFNNWKLFLDKIKTPVEGPKSNISNISMESPQMKQLENLSLSMEMDMFSAETYQKAERRKRALEQIYHDYSSVIIGELSLLKEIPVSCSFQYVYLGVKIYVLVWQVAICSVLFFGSVFEDKTALNIWGILNILSSFLHFMVDEWINTTFQPEKTSACIWFGVIYGVYKPLTILVVATLSSEILKKNGFKRKGLLANLGEVMRGRKRPPLSKILEKLGDASVTMNASESNNNGDPGKDESVAKIKMKVRQVELEDGNIFVFTRTSPSTKFSDGRCLICGTASSSLNPKESSVILEEKRCAKGTGARLGSRLHCSCVPTSNFILTSEDLYEVTEDEEEEEDEDELEEVVDDEDDSDEEDEEDPENEPDARDTSEQRRKELAEQRTTPNILRPATTPASSSVSNHTNMKVVVLSETKQASGKTGEAAGPGNHSTGTGLPGNLLYGGQPNGANFNITDGALNGPVVDGGNLHI